MQAMQLYSTSLDSGILSTRCQGVEVSLSRHTEVPRFRDQKDLQEPANLQNGA